MFTEELDLPELTFETKRNKRAWNDEEDHHLLRLVEQYGITSRWS
jgi:hypothetical protein